MAGGRLTAKQEAFAQEYVSNGGNGSAAYRHAYNSTTDNAQAVSVEAQRLKKNPLVALRIKEIQEELEMAAMWTRKNSLETLKDIAQGVDEGSKSSDKVQAVKTINQMMGWDKQVLDHQSTDGSMSPERKTLDDFYSDDA
jgi:phage terminase small subunit